MEVLGVSQASFSQLRNASVFVTSLMSSSFFRNCANYKSSVLLVHIESSIAATRMKKLKDK